ncbi:hypothetical protein DFQ27_004553 [Actinomortierella ambigua]|uniref:Uncharacterized protein n=1 Tax=Actinomortierella ambigua TaxID=1343610 RepID=A0A9P6U4B8_9FUNG|nr:hypothetical protein DFQ27_004553 [Actinomortierella ambigua]
MTKADTVILQTYKDLSINGPNTSSLSSYEHQKRVPAEQRQVALEQLEVQRHNETMSSVNIRQGSTGELWTAVEANLSAPSQSLIRGRASRL